MPNGGFVWYELMTSDVDMALEFYGAVLGWTEEEFPVAGMRYVVVRAAGKAVGGVMGLPEDALRPAWIGYLGTADVARTVEEIGADGGVVHRAPWDVEKVGRLAIVGDPQGAQFALMQSVSGEPSEAFDPRRPGHGNWNELHTSDPEAAFGFYQRQFGWERGDAIPMGPMGTYQIVEAGGVQMGGMFRMEGMAPGWLHYFGVESVEEGIGRVGAAGGTVVRGVTEVPGGWVIAQAMDPQGAMFALVGQR